MASIRVVLFRLPAELKLTAELTAAGSPLANREIKFYKSPDGVNYSLISSVFTGTNGIAEATDTVDAFGYYYYKAVFEGDGVYDRAEAVATYFHAEPLTALINNLMMLLLIVLVISVVISLLTGVKR